MYLRRTARVAPSARRRAAYILGIFQEAPLLIPDVGDIQSPVLAIDVGSEAQRAIFYMPGIGAEDQCRFLMPSPERTAAARIRQSTAERRGVYLHGGPPRGRVAGALAGHLEAGLDVGMHPDTAGSPALPPSLSGHAGLCVSRVCPPGFTPIALRDFDPDVWPAFASLAGLPRPETILVAAVHDDAPPDESGDAFPGFPAARQLAETRGAGLELRFLPHCSPPGRFLRLQAIRGITKFPVMDRFSAFLLGLYSLPAVSGRCGREGAVLLHMGAHKVRAGLVYRDRLFGVFERPAVHRDGVPGLLADLDSFRLGWLAPEKMRAEGGYAAFADPLPADAEGFRPLFVTGRRAELLNGRGIMASPCGDRMMSVCWGLLYGWSRWG